MQTTSAYRCVVGGSGTQPQISAIKSDGTRRSRFLLDMVNIDDSFAKPRYHMDAMCAGDTQSPEVFFPVV